MADLVRRAPRSDRLVELIDAIDILRHGDLDDVVVEDDWPEAAVLDEIDDPEDVPAWSETQIDPSSYSSYAAYETDGAAAGLSREELDEHWHDTYVLSKKEKSKFGRSGRTFLTSIDAWIDEVVQHYFDAIDAKTKKYKRKKWKLTAADLKVYQDAIDQLEDLRRSLAIELRAGKAHGVDLLTLADVVWNEAGTSSDAAKLAVAYAFMSFYGGVVPTSPSPKIISGYLAPSKRWKVFEKAAHPDTERLSFLRSFVPSLTAAIQRLDDASPNSNDPTHGADHWVSPVGLPGFDASTDTTKYYKRTYKTLADKAFPIWARDPSDPQVAVMQQAGSLLSSYKEFPGDHVSDLEFLFYTGVVK